METERSDVVYTAKIRIERLKGLTDTRGCQRTTDRSSSECTGP